MLLHKTQEAMQVKGITQAGPWTVVMVIKERETGVYGVEQKGDLGQL